MSQARKKGYFNPAHVGGDVMEYFRQKAEADPEYAAQLQDLRDRRLLGHRIRELREGLGLSQAEVAEQIGTKQPSVARIERAESLPKIETLQKLARVFGMRVQIDFVPAPKRRKRKVKVQTTRAAVRAGDEARPAVR